MIRPDARAVGGGFLEYCEREDVEFAHVTPGLAGGTRFRRHRAPAARF